MAKKGSSSSQKPKQKPALELHASDFDSSDDEFTGFEDPSGSAGVAEEYASSEDDIEVVPRSSKADETGQQKTKSKSKAKAKPAATATEPNLDDESDIKGGVVYVGRIPHGFFEKEMREYFGQFGTIKRLRLSRNKRTGASKHFAFIEFASAKVADIVVDTMDNYLMFGHILRVKRVRPETVHEKLWDGANRKFTPIAWGEKGQRLYKSKHGRDWWEQHAKSESERRKQRDARLKSLGISYKLS